MPKNIRPARVVSIISRKGGEGKTTFAHHLAAGAALDQYDTLAIEADDNPRLKAIINGLSVEGEQDLDDLQTAYGLFDQPDAGIANAAFGVHLDRLWEALPHISMNKVNEIRGQRNWSYSARFDYIAGSERLRRIDAEFAQKQMRTPGFAADLQFTKAIEPARQKYDLIVVDCPPNLTTILRNVLTASTHVIIPVSFDFAAEEDYRRTMRAYLEVRQSLAATRMPVPAMPFVVFNKYDEKNPDHVELLTAYQKEHQELVNGHPTMHPALIKSQVVGQIPFDGALLNRAAKHTRSLHQYAPISPIGVAMYEMVQRAELALGLK